MSPLPLYRRRPKPRADERLPTGCRDCLPDYDGCNQYEPVDMTIPYNVTALVGLALWTFAVAGAVAWIMS
jgi:hypothetical protein